MAFTAGQYLKASTGTVAVTDGVKRYAVRLSQTGTSAPVATVLENSLGGTVVWARTGVGFYTGTLAGAFTVNKTLAVVPGTFLYLDSNGSGYIVILTSANVLTINSVDGGVSADGLLSGAPVVIEVYP